MKTLALVIQYDGTNYGGWQIQPNADSVQERLKKALFNITGKAMTITGAGRTDAGVHARGQTASIRLNEEFPVPEKNILKAVNSNLPNDIKIVAAKLLDFDFDARKDATAREYSYTIYNRNDVFFRNYAHFIRYPFTPELLNETSAIFTGRHDFTTFSKLNEETKNYSCEVDICHWSQTGDYLWQLRIKADRFVYGMVRALTGAMLDVARGKRTANEIREALELCNRKLGSPLAPPNGLVLERVYYDENII